MMQTLKKIFSNYKHAWVLFYFFIYFFWFLYLEQRTDTKFATMHSVLDDIIPFCEYFIIPYLLWFFYIAFTIAYFFFMEKEGFYNCCAFLFIGMTICLLIYTFFPNQQNLRPTQFSRDNIFIDLVKNIYNSDTSTNVCPSIHCFNSIGAQISLMKSKKLRKKKWLINSTLLLTISICLSTVFLKQHSVVDGFCAILLSIFMYYIVYKVDYKKLFHRDNEMIKNLSKDIQEFN